MLPKNKNKAGGLLLAGLAAYAYYKYTRMNPEQRQNLVNDLKDKGKKYFDQYIPDGIKNFFSQEKQPVNPVLHIADNS